MSAGPLGKNFCSRQGGIVEEQFRTPFEVIPFARVKASGLFVFADGSQRIAQSLVEIA